MRPPWMPIPHHYHNWGFHGMAHIKLNYLHAVHYYTEEIRKIEEELVREQREQGTRTKKYEELVEQKKELERWRQESWKKWQSYPFGTLFKAIKAIKRLFVKEPPQPLPELPRFSLSQSGSINSRLRDPKLEELRKARRKAWRKYRPERK